MRRLCLYGIALVLSLVAAASVVTVVGPSAYGQATTAAGTIQGTITDPTGAVVPSTTITITNKLTGAVVNVLTNGTGYYSSGPLVPGTYVVSVNRTGFASLQATETVQIGNVTNGNLTLTVGNTTTQVEVQASDVRVDTQQSEVQGVLTTQQIENLPINGRNFLDLAQLEPGVQLQDGQNFDPTKAGYTSVSFNGINGRNARLSLDGQDISDETVGTTVLNVTQGSIEEFQVGRSDLDLSNEITSSGSVIVSTKSGTTSTTGRLSTASAMRGPDSPMALAVMPILSSAINTAATSAVRSSRTSSSCSEAPSASSRTPQPRFRWPPHLTQNMMAPTTPHSRTPIPQAEWTGTLRTIFTPSSAWRMR